MSVLTREGFHALTAQAKRDLQRSTDSVNVMVCAGTGCIAGGAMKVYEYLKSACERRGIPVAVSLSQEAGAKGIHLKKSGCHGFCSMPMSTRRTATRSSTRPSSAARSSSACSTSRTACAISTVTIFPSIRTNSG